MSVQYDSILGDTSKLVDEARRLSARSVNCVMTAAYWLIGKRIVEFEQSGEKRVEYGTALIERLAANLTRRFRRGFSRQNIQQMRLFYLICPVELILQTVSGESEGGEIPQTLSAESVFRTVAVLLTIGFGAVAIAYPFIMGRERMRMLKWWKGETDSMEKTTR